MFFLGLFLQSVIGYTPFEAGLLLLPSTGVLLVLAPRFGRLADRHGPRPFLVAGPMLMAGGMLLWLRVDDRTLWDGLLPGLVLYGLGLSMLVAPISLTATAVLGVVVSLVFAARTDDPNLVPLTLGHGEGEFVTGSTDAFRVAMVVAATLALAGAATALGLSRRAEPAEPKAPTPDAPPARLDPSAPDRPSAVTLAHQGTRGISRERQSGPCDAEGRGFEFHHRDPRRISAC